MLNINFENLQAVIGNNKEVAKEIRKSLKANFKNVKFSVTSSIYGINVNFDNDSITLDEVRNIVGHFDNYTYDTIYTNSQLTYYRHTEQHKEEQQKEYEQQQKEMQERRDARQKIYNDNVNIESIEDYKIIEVQSEVFVKALEPSLNKNDWKIKNDEYINESAYVNKYKITHIVELGKEEYNYFCFNMLGYHEFLEAGFGGYEFDEEKQETLYHYGVAIVCEGQETIIIDPQGYKYARYVNRLIEDINGGLQDLTTKTVKEETKVYNETVEKIEDSKVYIYNEDGQYFKKNRIQTLISDERLVLNDAYGCNIITTGKALKELLSECKGSFKPVNDILINEPHLTMEGLIKVDLGQLFTIGEKPDPRIKAVKWAMRLQKLLLEAGTSAEDLQIDYTDRKVQARQEAKERVRKTQENAKNTITENQNQQAEQPQEVDKEEIRIVYNKEKQGIEVYFQSIPSKDTREKMKSYKMRYHAKFKMWYCKDTEINRKFVGTIA